MSSERREVVILVGMQGAGKTHYCRTELSAYERICQDEGPRTYSGVLNRLKELLAAGVPLIVMDRTNPARYQREEFAALARGAGYRVKIIYFDTPVEICRERVRSRKGHPTLAEDRMNEAMAMYASRLEVPKAEECDELVVVK